MRWVVCIGRIHSHWSMKNNIKFQTDLKRGSYLLTSVANWVQYVSCYYFQVVLCTKSGTFVVILGLMSFQYFTWTHLRFVRFLYSLRSQCVYDCSRSVLCVLWVLDALFIHNACVTVIEVTQYFVSSEYWMHSITVTWFIVFQSFHFKIDFVKCSILTIVLLQFYEQLHWIVVESWLWILRVSSWRIGLLCSLDSEYCECHHEGLDCCVVLTLNTAIVILKDWIVVESWLWILQVSSWRIGLLWSLDSEYCDCHHEGVLSSQYVIWLCNFITNLHCRSVAQKYDVYF